MTGDDVTRLERAIATFAAALVRAGDASQLVGEAMQAIAAHGASAEHVRIILESGLAHRMQKGARALEAFSDEAGAVTTALARIGEPAAAGLQ